MNLSEKETKVLRELLSNSDRSQKQMSAASGISQSDFTRVKQDLVGRGIIKKFTVDLDYKKIGYPNTALFLFSVLNKKELQIVIDEIKNIPEVIEILEVFGEDHDIIIRLMCEDNERIRAICKEITENKNVNSGANTYTIIYSAKYKLERGIPI